MSTHTELRRGDKDSVKCWGGKKHEEELAYNVKALQNDLKAVGVYTLRDNGTFGPKTEHAVKIFQWVIINSTIYIKNQLRVSREKTGGITINGKLDKKTYDELKKWVNNQATATGDLIRIPFSTLSNIEAGPAFKKLGSPKVKEGELVISSGGKKLVTTLNEKAKDKSVTIKVNQAFRKHGVKVTGAVVSPATKSQHLIGHALDCNIVDGSNWNNAATFKKKEQTKNADDIIKSMKDAGFRWGGDFQPVDTPHFDSKLDSKTFAYEAKFYLNQRMISESQDIPEEKG